MVHNKKRVYPEIPTRAVKVRQEELTKNVNKEAHTSSYDNVSSMKTSNKTFDSISKVSKSVANLPTKIPRSLPYGLVDSRHSINNRFNYFFDYLVVKSVLKSFC